MKDLQVFNFNNNDLTTVLDDNGEIWFVTKDVCKALELSNVSQALSRLDTDEKGVIINDTLGGMQEMSTINESGLYSLILTSRKLEAKKFKKWITQTVLPSIRKTGGYHLSKSELQLTNEISKLEDTVELLSTTVECHKGIDKINTALQYELDSVKHKLSYCEWLLEGISDTSTRFSNEARANTLLEVISKLTLDFLKSKHFKSILSDNGIRCVTLKEPNCFDMTKEIQIPMKLVERTLRENSFEFKSPKFKTLFTQALHELIERNECYTSSNKIVLV